jgi:hypothetical protein
MTSYDVASTIHQSLDGGRGADIVIQDMADLVRLTHFFKMEVRLTNP